MEGKPKAGGKEEEIKKRKAGRSEGAKDGRRDKENKGRKEE